MSDRIKETILSDAAFCKTPDLPALRYLGRQPLVFLWDGLQDFTTFKTTIGIEESIAKHYESVTGSALTVGNYLPWYNVGSDDDEHPAYCLEEPGDALWLEEEDYVVSKPMQMQGKVCRLSLQALCLLDNYYLNGVRFERITIDVYRSRHSKDVLKCYTWFNSIHHIATESDLKYDLYDGIDLVPFRAQKINNKEAYYEM